jgi:hypothetical protein
MARLSLTAKAGIVLIAAPCLWLASWAAWHYSRNWVPLRVSLARDAGHVRTSEFEINLEGDYSIDLATDKPAQDCAERPVARWSLSKNGSILATGKNESRTGLLWPEWACTIGRFHADTGVYRLDLDLAKNPSLLVVYEDGWQFINSTAHGAHALMVCAILLPIGLATLVIGAIRRHEEKQADALTQWIFTQHGPLPGTPLPGARIKVSPRRKPRQVAHRAFSVGGQFSLNRHISSIVQMLMPLCVVVALAIPTPWGPSRGLAIRTIRPGVKLIPAAGVMPLRIRVLSDNQSGYRGAPMRGLEIGSQVIDRTDLAAFLTREMAKRPSDWPVYIEGDRELDFESVARTIDAVSAFGAKVILLTPSFKSDLGERSSERR